MDAIWTLFHMFLRDIVFNTVGLIFLMYLVVTVLYRPGIGFFALWTGVCFLLFRFVDMSAGLWSFLVYFLAIPGVTLGDGESEGSSFGCEASSGDYTPHLNTSAHSGSRYHSGGAVEHLPNGNTGVRYGDIVYMSNDIRRVEEGNVTYYIQDSTGKRLGRSVDQGNGVHNYFDDDNRYLGHSYTSGKVTEFFGDCFECR